MTTPEPTGDQRRFTDCAHLTAAAYGGDGPLAARQSIYAYARPPQDLPGWALAQVAWRGGETVLDVGCGNGLYLRRLATTAPAPAHLLGLDLSPGMLADLRRAWPAGALPAPPLAVADIQALPLPAAACDVALAMHMLYHVPDIGRAAAELRRVLRPGGALLASTNGAAHLREIGDLIARACARLTGRPPAAPVMGDAIRRFGLEGGGPLLQSAFARVERRDLAGNLVVPDAAPIAGYVASMAALAAADPSIPWSAVVAEVEHLAAAHIAAHGALRVTTHAGLFVCR